MLFTKNYQNQSVHACRNYILSKLARFLRHSVDFNYNIGLHCSRLRCQSSSLLYLRVVAAVFIWQEILYSTLSSGSV